MNKGNARMRARKSKLIKAHSRTGVMFAAPSIIGLIAFFILPLLISVFYAFYENRGTLGFGNFSRALMSPAFQLAIFNTGKLLLSCLSLLFIYSLTLVHLLGYINRSDKSLVIFFLALQLLPIAIPSSVTSLFITNLFTSNGIVNGVIVKSGGEAINFLGLGRSFIIMLILYLWKNSGIAVLMFYTRINAIPKEITEAASLDGAGAFKRLIYITLPLLKSALLFVSVIGIWGVFKISRESYLIFGNYPDNAVYGLQNFLNNHFSNANYTILSAASLIFLTLIAVLMLIPILFEKRKS